MAAFSPAWHDRWTARGFARTLGSYTGRCGIRLDLPSPATSLSDWEMNDLLARLSACEVTTRPVIAVGPSRDAREAAWITVEHRIGAPPALEAGRLAGIVTETGLRRAFAAGG